MLNNRLQVAVVGGGAAGLAAAIAAARSGACVTIYEAAKRVGQKILKTGNGRCNLTNLFVSACDYNDPAGVTGLIDEYPAQRVLGFFDSIGLLTSEEREGRVYPLSNSANTVLDVLRAACGRMGVEERCLCDVQQVRAADGGFILDCADGSTFIADRVVVASGGGSRLLEGFGHVTIPFSPVLCPLACDTSLLGGLSGIRATARVSAYAGKDSREPFAQETGEVLFRDYGLSGIVIFDMSRYAKPGDWLGLDFLPEGDAQWYSDHLADKLDSMRAFACGEAGSSITYAELMCGDFHARLNNSIIKMAGLRPSHEASPACFDALARAATDFRVEVLGVGDAKQAQVMRGGASLEEFDSLTLESRIIPGLYAAGEVLNVDGRCGGFNLHWAWAGGLAAGQAACFSS